MSYDESAEAVQPRNGAFDDPTPAVPAEFATILSGRPDTFLSMRADEINASLGQTISQRIGIRRFVVDQQVRDVICRRRVQQRLNQIHLGVVCRIDINGQRQAASIGQDHDLGSLAALGLADVFTPFFAGANVPSAKPSRQSIRPLLSSMSSRRFHALSRAPLPVHSAKRRQQVAYDGNRGGRSFQRAPLRRIHKMPSKQALGSAIGRPPLGLGSGLEKRSAISSQCSSLSSGCRSFVLGSVLDPAWLRDRSIIKGLLSRPYTHDESDRFS